MLTSRMQRQRIIVEQRRGGGCFAFLGLLLVAGLAINYWYIAAPLAVLLAGAWLWSMRAPAGPGSYECPRCHGDITRGTVTCTLCGWAVP